MKDPASSDPLFTPLDLPCGARLSHRVLKAAMSDALGDGAGRPTDVQARLYARWAEGGAALCIVGEVQPLTDAAEAPGNLVLAPEADPEDFAKLTRSGRRGGTHLWAQLGHAGALTPPEIGRPRGPSALDLPGLNCAEIGADEIRALPQIYAGAAQRARQAGFSGVEIHAAHGFLLSQFLSPLFNRRDDEYGGSLRRRMRLLLEVVEAVRAGVGPAFPVGLKINATDRLEGGTTEGDALEVLSSLEGLGLDLIDISGGTYFPGAPAASDGSGGGAYFRDVAARAKRVVSAPVMLTGGIKTRAEAAGIVASGDADAVGLARAFALDPALPESWRAGREPAFPRFDSRPPGGLTAWYTQALRAIGEDRSMLPPPDPDAALTAMAARDAARRGRWIRRFGAP
ncbi:oxidoreductase [Roseivivax sediminis]|uniref:2,4-dienoyl-CoA reductase n=1 Tax=Roseivivax sediminis TaxID=936889 RepID=A0A1I1YX95_9RHOB|nr:tRNA-dihydrouridine synthase [Roseivivax sediminis]SFE22793.1 2,4-dienoyl-CoA reductase [Roseivivax sediminis]